MSRRLSPEPDLAKFDSGLHSQAVTRSWSQHDIGGPTGPAALGHLNRITRVKKQRNPQCFHIADSDQHESDVAAGQSQPMS